MQHVYTPVDTTAAYLERESVRLKGMRIAALGILLLIVWLGSLLWLGHLLVEAGWARYYRYSIDPMAFITQCFGNFECRSKAFFIGYQQTFKIPPYIGLVGSGLLIFIGIGRVLVPPAKPTKLPGHAEFNKSWKQKYTQGISYLGHKENLTLKYPGDLRYKHTLVVGSTGVGKTSRVITPMLLTCAAEGRSAVVFDLKYPDAALLSMITAFEGYGRQVILLLPYEARSPRLPLLRGAEDPRIAMELADVVIPVKEREDSTTYYKDIERKLLATLINIEALYGQGSLGRIANLCEMGAETVHKHVQTYAPDAERRMGFFWELSNSDQAKMIAGLAGRLSVFSHPYLDRSTSFGPGEIDLASIARQPTIFYLGINQRYLMGGTGQLFLQMIKRHLDRILLEEAERNNGQLRVGVEIYLDEFTNLGYLPYMSDNLSTMRSRRVSYILTLQSINQGLERYKKEEIESIMANANTWILFGSGMGDTDAQRFSEAIGNASAFIKNETVHRDNPLEVGFWDSLHTYRLEAVPLIAKEEFRKIQSNQAIVRFAQDDPLIGDFPNLSEMIQGKASPMMQKLARWYMVQVERVGQSAEEIIRPYLLEEYEYEEAAPAVADECEELLSWATAMLKAGARTTAQYDPDNQAITKLSIIPIGGQPPAKINEWVRARWVKLEKGKSAVAIINSGLHALLHQYPGLVEWAIAATALREKIATDPDNFELKDGCALIHPEGLDKLGITSYRLEQLGARKTRISNRRGYLEFPLSYEWIEGSSG